MQTPNWNYDEHTYGYWIRKPNEDNIDDDGYLMVSLHNPDAIISELLKWGNEDIRKLILSGNLRTTVELQGARSDVIEWRARHRQHDTSGINRSRLDYRPPKAKPGIHSEATKEEKRKMMLENNPMSDPANVAKLSGQNHWKSACGCVVDRETSEVIATNLTITEAVKLTKIHQRRLRNDSPIKPTKYQFIEER